MTSVTPSRPATSSIFSDIHFLRKEIQAEGLDTKGILKINVWRALADACTDWILIFACVWLVYAVSWWLALIAVPLLGGRQRALGNLLHDAVHRNLSRNVTINTLITNCLIAPPMMSNFRNYTEVHLQHHMKLGGEQDPESFLPAYGTTWKSWTGAFLKSFFSPTTWIYSTLGVLVYGLSLESFAYIVLWWTVVTGSLGLVISWEFAWTFVALWFIARASTFHGFTAFRTLCDHWALAPGGVFSRSREVATNNLLRWFIHPYNNCFHLSHHLMPGIPYYHLPQAHQLFQKTKIFREQAIVCDAYFFGPKAVIRYKTVKVESTAF